MYARTTRITDVVPVLIASPQGSGVGATVGTYELCPILLVGSCGAAAEIGRAQSRWDVFGGFWRGSVLDSRRFGGNRCGGRGGLRGGQCRRVRDGAEGRRGGSSGEATVAVVRGRHVAGVPLHGGVRAGHGGGGGREGGGGGCIEREEGCALVGCAVLGGMAVAMRRGCGAGGLGGEGGRGGGAHVAAGGARGRAGGDKGGGGAGVHGCGAGRGGQAQERA